MQTTQTARPMAILALAAWGLCGGAAAQVAGPADAGVQNQIFMEQQAQQRQVLEQQRQSYLQEQQALTQRNLSDLAAARRGEPASVTPGQPPLSSALSARALTLGRLADEAAARLTRLTLRPRTTRRP